MTILETSVLIIFIITFALIISEKLNRTIAALCGGAAVILIGALDWETALHHIDFNTLGVLTGMMIIVAILRKTGLFEYLAIYSAKRANGDPWKIFLSLALITAVFSAFLDNVTTVLLMAPITIVITNTLKINPIPYLIGQILFSNIGGTATLIGDPPNIMIGSATHLTFLDFIINLAPVAIVVYIVTMFIFKVMYKKNFKVSEEAIQEIMSFNEKKSIKDTLLLKKSLFALALVMLGFFTHSTFHLETAVIALSGASFLMLISRPNVEEILNEVEWPTIFFFMGLFVVVGAMQEVGLINLLAETILDVTNGNVLLAGLAIIWLSAIVSAFVDNIPFVATMIPLIHAMAASGMEANPLWWALALGACLGGNGTLIGASANVIVAGIAERNGHRISYGAFFKIGFPMMLISIIIATGYLLLFYL